MGVDGSTDRWNEADGAKNSRVGKKPFPRGETSLWGTGPTIGQGFPTNTQDLMYSFVRLSSRRKSYIKGLILTTTTDTEPSRSFTTVRHLLIPLSE